MLESIKQRLGRDDEQGFTLIELMVVVLIIAILLAIAIPTFLGARNSANARSAQSDLRNAATAEQTFWTNNQAWGTYGDMQAVENSLNWVSSSTVVAGNNVLISTDATSNGVVLTAAGKDNHCYSEEIIDQPIPTTGAPAGTYYNVNNMTGGSCSAPSPVAAPGGATAGSAAAHIGTTFYTTW